MKILSHVRCSCDSRGNPLPSLLWEFAGEALNHSSDSPIRELPLGSASVRSLITLYGLDENPPPLICHSLNALGADSFAFNVSTSPTQLGEDFTLTLSVYLLTCIDLFSTTVDSRSIYRPPFCLPAGWLCCGSAGNAAGLCPAADFLLPVRKTK